MAPCSCRRPEDELLRTCGLLLPPNRNRVHLPHPRSRLSKKTVKKPCDLYGTTLASRKFFRMKERKLRRPARFGKPEPDMPSFRWLYSACSITLYWSFPTFGFFPNHPVIAIQTE